MVGDVQEVGDGVESTTFGSHAVWLQVASRIWMTLITWFIRWVLWAFG